MAPIASEYPGLSNLAVHWKELEIKNTKDLIIGYLNCRDDEFVIRVDFEEKMMTYMDTAVQGQYNDMLSKFKNMMSTSAEEQKTDSSIPLENGVPTKEGLLMIVRHMAETARTQVMENSRKFM
jgi:hypothetical protein